MPAETTTNAKPTRLCELLDAWAAERIATEGTKKANAHKQAKRLKTLFTDRGWTTTNDLTRAGLVEAFSDTALSIKTRATLMSTVSSFCAWAVKAGHQNVSPMATIARPTARGGRRGPTARRGMRPLSNAEVHAVLTATMADEAAERPRLKAYRSLRIALAWMTGGRLDQIAVLRWRDLELDTAAPSVVYDADESKNQAGWRIPLTPRVVEIARAWRTRCEVAGADDLVFPVYPRYRIREFIKDLKAAGVPRVRGGRPAGFHSLRKTFARNLVFGGVPINVAQQLMQHKTLEMTVSVYAECQQEDKIAASEAASVHVEKEIVTAIHQPNTGVITGRGVVENPPNEEKELTRMGGDAESNSAQTMVAFPRQLDSAPRAELPAALKVTGLSNLSPAAGSSAVGAVGSILDVVAGENRLTGEPETSTSNRAGRIRTAQPDAEGRLGFGTDAGGAGHLTATERALIAALRREEALRRQVAALSSAQMGRIGGVL
ncbi:tyrosine-type recombinase/integrase [Tolypothrix sp. VBCCA 56010]|uniref:tyrosine-type recombinase/integrase n=1 Tax=Tolypothrix sp. VBCCA 56010 TaxID=3137731 RepID=UPI003D7E82FA